MRRTGTCHVAGDLRSARGLERTDVPAVGRNGYRDVGVLDVVHLLVEGHDEGLSLRFGDDQIDQVVVGLDADIRSLGRDDDLHGA